MSCSTGKNLLNALVFLPMILQGAERKKLVSQEFLLKNADQRFCANYFLQLFNTSFNYGVLKNILRNNFWALLLFPSIYCHKKSQPLEMLKDDFNKNEGDSNGVFDKNTNSARSAALCPDQKTLRGGGFFTSIDTLTKGLDPPS